MNFCHLKYEIRQHIVALEIIFSSVTIIPMRQIFPLFVVLALAGALTGCASTSNFAPYSGAPIQELTLMGEPWRVQDRPDAGTMSLMRNPRGALFAHAGAALAGTPEGIPTKPVFVEAARQYLGQSGRARCKVLDAYLLESPFWEVRYECS